jgi:membrane protein implicated in regulation of membrane protease activity
MGAIVLIGVASTFAIKGLALLALALVVYLYWLSFREKRDQRRERQWLEDRRRELKEKTATKVEPPHKP